ncbi:glycosyltransferase [Corynebacterium sp. L4756]|uniref:galactofuranosyltransferase GlfT1 n=1 Tax=unclassified Corynebacterium TaxID=2624378 RepID=UPI00374DCA8A
MSTSHSHAPQVAPLSSSGSTAAVIVTHNRVELLRASLEQVVAQTHPVKWVIVVDNGAEAAVKNLVEELAGERAVYVASKTNLGGAGGFALGFLTALSLGADAIWCADDDGWPADAAVLAELYRVAEANQLHEVSPAVCNINDPGALAFPLRQGLVWRRRMEELEGDFLPGIASLFNGALISGKAMEIIGVPDYRLFIRGDEVEYHRRLVNSGLSFGTALTCAYLHPDGSDEFKPILGGKMHTQYPEGEFKRYFTYRNRGYLLWQRGMRKLLPQEFARFGWFFLVQQHDPKGFMQWLKLHNRGRREDFRRPEHG